MSKYYKKPWNESLVALMRQWWPHFGTYGMEQILFELTRSQIKSKATKMGLSLLPKTERLCVECRQKYQYKRYAGLRCTTCHLNRRKLVRKRPLTTEQWITMTTNTIKHRSKKSSDLDVDYMVQLWNQQSGKCYYSGLKMRIHQYGEKRHPLSPSVDRIDSSKGYIKGNIVWSSWICNAGKSSLSVQEYIKICRMVSEKWKMEI